MIIFLTSHFVLSQVGNLLKTEDFFIEKYQRISNEQDSEIKANLSLDYFETFKDFLSKNQKSFTYDFQKIKKETGLYVATSKDGKLRFYTWDTQMGGTMKNFAQIIQFQSDGKVATLSNNSDNDAYFVSKIFDVNINNKRYYLVISNGVFSTKDVSQAVQALRIENGKLIDTDKIFRTKKETLNRIESSFDFFSVVNRPERPLELITFDDKTDSVYFPLVNEKGEVTPKRLVYQKKGNYFEFKGIQ
ncbi:hypothetical protein [Epilithonimonas mollis]|uniref:Uncharacterized protein n=1 Tax=Epilithonimonas mollis TaxID=216903 RepID=A0A1M6PMS1_9FLAO|nr:hypothetical protein [Epilithonimonas mollis]SHK09188.1 hypothetical protein SAMN05444371_1191 [Epilithonimonas mollis]